MKSESKICNVCKETKPLTDFYFRSDTKTYKNRCKQCCIDGNNMVRSTTHKVCKHCGEEKPFSEYQKAGGGKWLQPYCKPCDAKRKRKHLEENFEKVSKQRRKYYAENKEDISKRQKERYYSDIEVARLKSKECRIRNIDKIRAAGKEYGKKNRAKITQKLKEKRHSNPEYYKEKAKKIRDSRTPEQVEAKKKYDREYKQKNKERLEVKRRENADKYREQKRIWSNKKAATDITYRIKRNLRTRIRCALKGDMRYKVDKSEALLGCSIEFYKEYFSSLFTEGMSWEKFMAGEIEIDHIRPCASFNLTIESEQRACFHYANTQPLWMLDNIRKGAKYQKVA
jgi:hypothetical protein